MRIGALARNIAAQWIKFRGLIRPGSLDLCTPEGRAAERHRRVVLSALASALAKMISVATMLISVPLTLHYLGPERYGMWMTISSFAAILAFADLGIGNGMLNAIAAAHGRDDPVTIRSYISSGFFALSLVAIGLLGIFAAAYQLVPWPTLFNVQSEVARKEAGPAVAVFFICFALAIPLSIVQRVQMALQRGFLSSLWQCLGSAFGLIGVLVAIGYKASLPWLVLAFVGTPLIALAINHVLFFGHMQRQMAPVFRSITRGAATQLLRAGMLFMVLQLVVAVAYASDSLVIAQLLGPAAVADYSVPERMFTLITMIIAMVLSPLWPAYGEALARGDDTWIRQTLRRSLIVSVALSFSCSFTLIFIGPRLLELWIGKAIVPSTALLVGLAVWKTVEAGGTALAVFLNGTQHLKIQLLVAVSVGILAMTLKIVLTPILGISGTTWATVIAYSALVVLPFSIYVPKMLKKMSAMNFEKGM